MTTSLIFLLSAAASYLLGSVPFAFIIARGRGIDIRSVGSGNVGATNVWRSVGKAPGLLTFACDALKGFVPAYAFPLVAAARLQADPAALGVLCACCAVAGHNWPVFLRFRGGKGMATTVGALLGVAPAAVGVMIAVWLALFALTRYVSVGSIGGAVALAVSSWFLYPRRGSVLPAALTALGALAVWRHRGNIRRLMQGTENRAGRRDR